jgi:hypothetical protein
VTNLRRWRNVAMNLVQNSQDVRKVGVDPKSNNGSRAKRPRWADYVDFEEDIDDFGDEDHRP